MTIAVPKPAAPAPIEQGRRDPRARICSGVMDELLAIIEQETALVRAGKLAGGALVPTKTDLAPPLCRRRRA